MAHFAQIVDGIVTRVVVVSNDDIKDGNGVEQESLGQAFLNKLLGQELTWVQTSYNNNFRKMYAGVGMTYDSEKDIFIHPQPYSSYTLDENSEWQAPIDRPDDDISYAIDPKGEDIESGKWKRYDWDEDNLSWRDLQETL
ncbi:MAG: hypothetical protein QGH83_13315 [Candidatus Pacebacteria bacterium]|jgi:hypothetical protein|nr:hypothetical protein [Candidatus Paceibacterota bacterium]